MKIKKIKMWILVILKIKHSRFKSGVRVSRQRVKFCKAAYKLHPLSYTWRKKYFGYFVVEGGWMQLRELIRRPCSDVLRNISRVARNSGSYKRRKYRFKLEPSRERG